MSTFAAHLVAWQREYGRHDLPWQNTRDPYRIWLSEVMLQQTQVATVIPYYMRFLARFPELSILAAAPSDAVLALWSGLGYYSRARNLHRTARLIVENHGGEFPPSYAEIVRLPGIGRSTAAAILVFSRGERRAILDGNVKRVLARACAVRGYPGDKPIEIELWQRAEALLPEEGVEAYTQGLMDLGARICTRTKPKCERCPVAAVCVAHIQGRETSYPEPRPTKFLPERETLMMIVLHRGSVLLEKRPPAGIWGGLWSLPEAATHTDAATLCRERFGVRAAQLMHLDPMRHGFTHFRLTIYPVAVDVAAIEPRAAEPGMIWLHLDAAPDAALPAPIKKLLAGIRLPPLSESGSRAA
jgi:A/G-specific adenine glycosylase